LLQKECQGRSTDKTPSNKKGRKGELGEEEKLRQMSGGHTEGKGRGTKLKKTYAAKIREKGGSPGARRGRREINGVRPGFQEGGGGG